MSVGSTSNEATIGPPDPRAVEVDLSIILTFSRQQFFTPCSCSTIFSKYCCQSPFFPMSNQILFYENLKQNPSYLSFIKTGSICSEFFQSFHIWWCILKKIQFFLSYYASVASVFSLKILQLLILVNEAFQTSSSSHYFPLSNNIYWFSFQNSNILSLSFNI